MVAENEDFSLLLQAVAAADETAEEGMELLPLLSGSEKMITIFAPNNAAVEKLLEDLGIEGEDLFSDADSLRGTLLYHIVGDDDDDTNMKAPVMAADLTDGAEIDTANEDA